MALVLNVTNRETEEVPKYLRQDGQLPGVVYGAGSDPVALKMDAVEFEKAFRESSYSMLIDLTVDGQIEKVLVKEIQYHPVTDDVLNVDFIRVDMNKEITADVSLVFVGTAPAIKEFGSVVAHPRDTISITCLPAHLVHNIEVSLESLAADGDSIHIRDIVMPEGVVTTEDSDTVVAQAMATREDEEEEEVEIASVDDVEVAGEKKDEEEGSSEENKS